MITKNGYLIDKVVQNSCYEKVVNFAHSKYNHECMQHRASCVHNGKKSAATGNNNNKQENFLCKKRQLDGSLAFPIFLQQVSNRHMTDQVTDQVDERCERSWHWWWISSWLAWMTIGTTGCDCFGKGQIHGNGGGEGQSWTEFWQPSWHKEHQHFWLNTGKDFSLVWLPSVWPQFCSFCFVLIASIAMDFSKYQWTGSPNHFKPGTFCKRLSKILVTFMCQKICQNKC